MGAPSLHSDNKSEDKRLDRLYDYTKFHIGIYLSAASGLAALISAASATESRLGGFLSSIYFRPMLGLSFLAMVIAGIAGAVVATSAIQYADYCAFLRGPQGAFGCEPFSGKTWIRIEHGAFWFSLVALAIAVFSADGVLAWLRIPPWLALVIVAAIVVFMVLIVVGHVRWKNHVPTAGHESAPSQGGAAVAPTAPDQKRL